MLYQVARAVLSPLVRVLLRPRIEGRHLVPESGPVLIASNHLSFIDSVIIPLAAPRRVIFLAKSDYFDKKGLKGTLTRRLFVSLGSIPVNRSDGRSAQASLDQALEYLQQGLAFGIYPEGTRSRDGRLYRGRVGVAWLALTAGCPIVPVGVIGTDKVMPVDRRLPRLHRYTVRFGAPMTFPEYAGMARSSKARREVTDGLMAEIARLSGQEQAGEYNLPPP